LLWEQGNTEAALRLEALWNDLRKTHSFVLYCAYPMRACAGETLADPVKEVCANHSRVIPAESYAALPDADERLRAIIELQQKAATLEAEIAERRQAEAALRAVKDELEIQVAEAKTANRMKDEFLATVSHELRTPLNAIIGWSHLLRRGELDEAMAGRAVETIERNARAQAQLVEDLLDVSRVITGKLQLKIGSVDLAAVINAAIDAVQLAASSKSLRLEVTLDPSARHIAGDASRLQQVIWNLLSNAIKFTPKGGRVEVRLERAASSARVRVTDCGEGISKDFLPFIFDRFRQADGTSTRRHGGLGLGLAIVRHLTELHGGAVYAESRGPGCGATFTIELPLTPMDQEAQLHKPEAEGLWVEASRDRQLQPPLSLEGIRLLLVDDDRDTLQLLSAVLSEFRAHVETASRVEDALKVLQWYRPDVLVSDLAMPGEDGFSLIRKVRELEAQGGTRIAAVALTAYTRVEDRARALSEGFNMFVAKPFEPSELLTVIANLCETGSGESGWSQ
jgi:signal transduction histidine kinase/CheY-like chemotaxis protein